MTPSKIIEIKGFMFCARIVAVLVISNLKMSWKYLSDSNSCKFVSQSFLSPLPCPSYIPSDIAKLAMP